ncbi:MAG: hypothetical protein ACYCZJ_02080 [Sulfuriferula sp.]
MPDGKKIAASVANGVGRSRWIAGRGGLDFGSLHLTASLRSPLAAVALAGQVCHFNRKIRFINMVTAGRFWAIVNRKIRFTQQKRLTPKIGKSTAKYGYP